MNQSKQALRIGALALLLAMLLRLLCSGVLGSVMEVFAQPELASFLIYTETGRKPDTTEPPQTDPPKATDPTKPADPTDLTDPTDPSATDGPTTPPTEEPTQPPHNGERPVFTEADVEYAQLNRSCSYNPSMKQLLTQTLNWDLTGDKPTILIVHTHGTEAYTPTAGTEYKENGGEFRTLDDRYNMISVGDELTRLLEARGLTVIHDRTPHDKNDYLDAYENSRKAVKEWLAQYPSIKMVLDLHRDAAENSDGSQWATKAEVNGERSAQLMFVVGTDATGLTHPNWKTNLSIAGKLNVLMERNAEGVTRDINLRGQRFNQDLAMGAMIVEVGSAGNTHQEAINAVSVLAEAIWELAHGAN